MRTKFLLGVLGVGFGVLGCTDDLSTTTSSTSAGGGGVGGGTSVGGGTTTTTTTSVGGGTGVGGTGVGGGTAAGCGDGSLGATEQCDDGNTVPGDGCTATCTLEACGDGVLDPPLEECDDGGTTNGDGCNSACQLEPVGQMCGGTLGAGEKCDDGNLLNGDGCNPTCNFLTKVTELAVGIPGSIITSDGTYLYVSGSGANCQIHRVAIASCAPGSCVFTPFVGVGGCVAPRADGPGATAVLRGGGAMAFGAGNLYFSDGNTVRAVDLSSVTLDVTTVAGDPARCGHLDGTGTGAVMSDVRGMAFYGGLLYFVDANMAMLKQVDPTTGVVTTLAGVTPNDNANTSYNCATNLCCGNTTFGAPMNSPRYMTSDNSGNLFIIDTNGNAILRYDIASGMLTPIVSGTGYVDGVGAAVRMDRPRGITSDGTSVYFGEQDENTIRQVELATATTSTFVGVRGCLGPANLAGSSGGDGTQIWTGSCGTAGAVSGKPQFETGAVTMTFDYGTKSIFAIGVGNRLLRIE